MLFGSSDALRAFGFTRVVTLTTAWHS